MANKSFEDHSYTPETEYIPKLNKDVGGWFSLEESLASHDHAKNITGKGVIVEIGSWQGKSTVYLGKGSLAGRKTPVFKFTGNSLRVK